MKAGEFFALLGPSGCGKTTLLRILAGFEPPSAGHVEFGAIRLSDLPPHRRPVNTVFQNYALFPHLSVFDNVAFGLKIRRVVREEIAPRVHEALDLVNLPGFGSRRIPDLSGGEKQRVALARALVNRPAVLLLDEPLAALDLQLRRKVQFEIKEIHRRIGATFVYVTHDQEEALAMSDRIAVIKEGEVEQIGTPQEIYDRPASRFVAHFIGSSNLLEGTVRTREDGAATVAVPDFGDVACPAKNGTGEGDRVCLMIRPEKIEIVQDRPNAQGTPAHVEETLYMGALIRYRLRVGTESRVTAVTRATGQRSALQAGHRVRIRWAREDVVLLER